MSITAANLRKAIRIGQAMAADTLAGKTPFIGQVGARYASNMPTESLGKIAGIAYADAVHHGTGGNLACDENGYLFHALENVTFDPAEG